MLCKHWLSERHLQTCASLSNGDGVETLENRDEARAHLEEQTLVRHLNLIPNLILNLFFDLVPKGDTCGRSTSSQALFTQVRHTQRDFRFQNSIVFPCWAPTPSYP